MTPEEIAAYRFKRWQDGIEQELQGQRRLLLIVVYGLIGVGVCWAAALVWSAL